MPSREANIFVFDLETLDTAPTAVVLSIGVAWGTSDSTQWNLPILPQIIKGRTISENTADWWKGQSQEVQEAASEFISCDVEGVLEGFCKLLPKDKKSFTVWGNSPSFDMVILSSLLKQFGFEIPWRYSQERDLRTLSEIVGTPYEFHGETQHVARFDARSELDFILKHLPSHD